MSVPMGVDLGLCEALRPDGSRCPGRFVVDGQVDGLVEATCSVCGGSAACPVGRLRPASERDESWWQK